MRVQQPKIRLAVFVMILMIAAPSLSVAQRDLSRRLTFQIVREESEIHFAVTVAIVPDFSGRVERFQRTIGGFLPNLEQNAFADIVIEAASMNTGLRPRDRDMHRALEVETYPRIHFSMDPVRLEYLGDRLENEVKALAA
ncbi:MAG: YceI family protein [Candidatus Marinimicrobia bacterium]|nr:YceI family protein [Candidatus Neomarinimicrobiota bacterium]